MKKALLLAAGKGTRMLYLTENTPKPLVQVNGKPFLYYIIKNLETAGFEDITLVVGYLKEKIIDYLTNNAEFDADFHFIEQKEQLGTGHAVMVAEKYMRGNFILFAADHIYDAKDLAGIPFDDDQLYMYARNVENPEKFGVIYQKDGLLEKIIEKPKHPESDLVNISLYKLTPKIFDALKKISLSERGEYEITDAINIIAQESDVYVKKLTSYWLDLGCPEDVPKVESILKNKF